MGELYSFIIPIYNTQDYIGRCLDSILNQTYKNFEIICVDDGSTDDSLSILESYEKKFSQIKVFTQKNGGVSRARNLGLQKMNEMGYVSFVDSDDWVHPRFLEILDEIREKTKADIVACDYKKVYEQEEIADFEKASIKAQQISCADLFGNVSRHLRTYIWGRIYSKNMIRDCKFVEELKIGEDKVFNMDSCCKKNNLNFIYINAPMYYYYMRENSAVHTLNNADVIEMVEKAYLPNLKNYGFTAHLVIEQCYRTLLSARYLSSCQLDTQRYERCNKLMDDLRISSCLEIPRIKRCIYRFFRRRPWAFRLYRIMQDPTLIKYEKSQGKNRGGGDEYQSKTRNRGKRKIIRRIVLP